MFLRDAAFNLLASILVIIFGIIGYITWWMSLIFIMNYLIFIITVIYMERK